MATNVETVKSGAEMIGDERQRQVNDEGWTPEHDDTHNLGQMARAAACYAMRPYLNPEKLMVYWPWHDKWWKPADRDGKHGPSNLSGPERIRELVKAGALIAAEIDRVQRETDRFWPKR